MNPEEMRKKVEEALYGSEEEKKKKAEEEKKKKEQEEAEALSDDPPQQEEEDEGMPEGPGFMALYTILMLLLMTFFIVLVSMASPSTGKFAEGKQSLSTTFKLMGLNQSKEALYFIYSVLRIKNSLIKEAIESKEQSEARKKGGKKKKDGMFFGENVSPEKAEQLSRFIALGFNISAKDVGAKYLIVRFPSGKVFVPHTAELKWDIKSQLKSFLRIIGTDYDKIVVRVYTSDTPDDMSGLSTPLELSAIRANAVADFIAEEHGIPRGKVYSIGYGEYYYGVDNIPPDKKEIVELDIYGLWEDELMKKKKEELEALEKSVEKE